MKIYKNDGVVNVVNRKQGRRLGFDFNNAQYKIFREALKGLTRRTESVCGVESRAAIIIRAKNANVLLDNWKIDICTSLPFGKRAKLFRKYGYDYVSRCKFSEIGITTPVIVDKLILEGILPCNFYSIK